MRTKLSTCRRKRRFPSVEAAIAFAAGAGLPLAPYRCDRCAQVHLTSRTKGKFRHTRPAPAERGVADRA